MYVVYMYDLKAKNKKKFNRLKRRFYYHMNKLGLKKEAWVTKSTIRVKPKTEKMMDLFFGKFGKDVIVYKLHTTSIEELE